MAQNTIGQEEHQVLDDLPIAVRRKRRISSGLIDPISTNVIQQPEDESQRGREAPKTPTKPKKRVRFSEPGPETYTASSSTGLTPHLSRASFTPRVRASSPTRSGPHSRTPRRLSLPTQLPSSLPSPSLSPSPGPLSGEVQFEPLRQILDARLKRRISRNRLSEEINDIDSKKRDKAQWRQEINRLKDQLALAKDSNQEHSEGSEDAGSLERIQQLEQEIVELKREQTMTTDSMSASAGSGEPATSEVEIFVDNEDDGPVPQVSDDGILRELDQTQEAPSLNEATTQTSLPSPHAETFRTARLDLEYLFPGEIALGLIPEDPKPLLDIMLDRIRILKAQTLLAEDTASTTKQQEVNLRKQFNAVLEQLDRARNYADGLSMQSSNEKARADASQARAQACESDVQAATSRLIALEKVCDEKDRSITRLQDALDSYRVEVGKLEMLITRMEDEHNVAMSALRAEMDEAVADLECHVVAETTGRREAEQEIEEKNERIKQLKVQEHELKNALNEKQQIIRETERIFEEERVGREREAGVLNVRIGQLSSDLSEANIKVASADQKQQHLLMKLQEEQDAGLRAVEAVQRELAACAEKSDDIKLAHMSDVQRRGAEVTEHKGLLTPVSACRFKDVEGYVETRRGKARVRNRDSGVVIMEEEDEDELMADVL
ncbi:hypothetical protein JMJ35_001437 [Cladonia borealis]|uniref:Uncharacterized protein n=1 Tax=Cladonia borealis TaxID=184061 RepID=A0AA39RAP0_9LECA|nr:hypothetical protein JMJ35_001437 [Cladonia borealis]